MLDTISVLVMALPLVLVMGLLVYAAYSDIKNRKIPNWVSGAVFLLFLVYLGAQWLIEGAPVLVPPLSSLVTGLATLVVFAGLFYFNLIGGGDVKLISATAFWAGQAHIVSFIVIMALTGGLLAFFYIIKRDRTPDIGIKIQNPEEKHRVKKQENEVKGNKNKNKSGKIPYGIAISVGGLFVVNRILTILIA